MKNHEKLNSLGYLLIPSERVKALDGLVNDGVISGDTAAKLSELFAKNKSGKQTAHHIYPTKMALDAFIHQKAKPQFSAGNSLTLLQDRMRAMSEVLGTHLSPKEWLFGKSVLDFGAGVDNPFNLCALLYANGAENCVALEPQPIEMRSARSATLEMVKSIFLDPTKYNLTGIENATLKHRVSKLHYEAFDSQDENGDTVDLGNVKHVKRYDDLRDLKFDLILSTAVLEHVEDVHYELDRHYALMNPGAVCVHHVDFKDHEKNPDQFFSFYYQDMEKQKKLSLNQFRAIDIQRTLESTGIDVSVVNIDMAEKSHVDKSKVKEVFQNYRMKDLLIKSATFVGTRRL